MAITYKIVNNVDYTIEELGNQFTAFRQLQWGDSDKTYLDLRRWRNTPDGGEMPAKGMTFLSEDGPNELINVLTKNGYGDTKEILNNLKDREDFRKTLNTVLGKEDELYDESSGELTDGYFDPNELLNM